MLIYISFLFSKIMFGGYFFLTDQQCFSEGAVNGYFKKKNNSTETGFDL